MKISSIKEHFLEQYRLIFDRAKALAEIEKGTMGDYPTLEIDPETGSIELSWSEYACCGEYDHYAVGFSWKDLDKLPEEALAEKEEKERLALEAAKEEKRRAEMVRKEAQELREQKEYERLKAKFENHES